MTTVNPHLARPPLLLGAPIGAARRVVVLVHGRDQAPAYVQANIVDRVADPARAAVEAEASGVSWLLPHADGGTWYPERLLAPLAANEPRLSHALAAVDAAVAAASAHGVVPERIVLAGFSQGGCLVTEYAVRHPRRYGGVVAWTGGLLGPRGTAWPADGDLAGTPAVVTTAEADPALPVSRAAETAAHLERMGAAVDLRILPGGDHLVRPEEIALLTDVLTFG
jgi:phospholipase/carboxylesterase